MCPSSREHVVNTLSLVSGCAYLRYLDSCAGAALATPDMLRSQTRLRPPVPFTAYSASTAKLEGLCTAVAGPQNE